jgi:hypothetical protein
VDSLNLKIKVVNVALSTMRVEISQPAIRLQSELHYISNGYPTLRPEGLEYLLLLQPILVIPIEKIEGIQQSHSYQLVAGTRTFQMLCEQHGTSKVVRVHCLSEFGDQQLEFLRLMDAVGTKVLQHPTEVDLGWIAYTLKQNQQMRRQLDRLFPVGTDEQLAQSFGMRRSTLNEKIANSKKWDSQKNGNGSDPTSPAKK